MIFKAIWQGKVPKGLLFCSRTWSQFTWTVDHVHLCVCDIYLLSLLLRDGSTYNPETSQALTCLCSRCDFLAAPDLIANPCSFTQNPLANFSPSLEPAVSSSCEPSTGLITLLQERSHFTPYYDSGYWISDALGLLRQRLTHVYLTWWTKWICPLIQKVLSSVHLRSALLSNNSFLWLCLFEFKAFHQVLGRRDLWFGLREVISHVRIKGPIIQN